MRHIFQLSGPNCDAFDVTDAVKDYARCVSTLRGYTTRMLRSDATPMTNLRARTVMTVLLLLPAAGAAAGLQTAAQQARAAEIQRIADRAYEHAMAGETRAAIADYDALLQLDEANALA